MPGERRTRLVRTFQNNETREEEKNNDMQMPDEQSGHAERMESEEELEVIHTLSGESPSPLKTRQRRPSLFQESTPFLVELLATLGHEFRTPLAVITGSTSTLLRQGERMSKEDQQEFLLMIQQAGQRLQVLTESMFELAQLEAGTFPLEEGVVDIPTIARETITDMQALVPESLRERVTFHLHCRDEMGNPTQQVPAASGDRRAVRKVLGHLLENALRFSPQGGRIDVVVRPTPHEKRTSVPNQAPPLRAFLEICVCDFGIGIPAEHVSHIFERFYQVDTSLVREVNGLGIGLTICNYLVALHHGRIWVESCSAGGSAFHVWLPQAEPILPV
jgi:signal transduction histidine kinase